MMGRTSSSRIGVVLLVVPLLAVSAVWGAESFRRLRADHHGRSERQLRHLEELFSTAFNNRDADTLDRLLAEDFIFTNEQGSVSNKAQYIDFVVNHIRVVSAGISDLVVRTYGDAAVAVARFDGDSVIDGQPVHDSFRFTDVWVRRSGRWYVIASHNSPIPP